MQVNLMNESGELLEVINVKKLLTVFIMYRGRLFEFKRDPPGTHDYVERRYLELY